jgi:hypothetical protein
MRKWLKCFDEGGTAALQDHLEAASSAAEDGAELEEADRALAISAQNNCRRLARLRGIGHGITGVRGAGA